MIYLQNSENLRMPCIHFKEGKGSSMLTSNVELRNGTILVTGAAGFIGANLVRNLLRTVEPITVIGLDNINNYYDISIKDYQLTQIEKESADHPTSRWELVHGNIADKALVEELFEKYRFSVVVNLAAQAGVRHSIDSPDVYIESNIIGFYNILETCRKYPVEHLVYASSSSVYGSNTKVPYSTDDKANNPLSLYAATKKSNELFAHAYSKLYNLPATGLRFFTVYGPAGDMHPKCWTENPTFGGHIISAWDAPTAVQASLPVS